MEAVFFSFSELRPHSHSCRLAASFTSFTPLAPLLSKNQTAKMEGQGLMCPLKADCIKRDNSSPDSAWVTADA